MWESSSPHTSPLLHSRNTFPVSYSTMTHSKFPCGLHRSVDKMLKRELTAEGLLQGGGRWKVQVQPAFSYVAPVLALQVTFSKAVKRQGPFSILTQVFKILQSIESHRNSAIRVISKQTCIIISMWAARSLHMQDR